MIKVTPTKKGTLYGIHFQNNPKPQTKLLYCTKGKGFDFAVDLRRNSKTYKKWVCVDPRTPVFPKLFNRGQIRRVLWQ
jgi:dTDP-4-dehydrorhamnose 3,5-epimerase-like enzyme